MFSACFPQVKSISLQKWAGTESQPTSMKATFLKTLLANLSEVSLVYFSSFLVTIRSLPLPTCISVCVCVLADISSLNAVIYTKALEQESQVHVHLLLLGSLVSSFSHFVLLNKVFDMDKAIHGYMHVYLRKREGERGEGLNCIFQNVMFFFPFFFQ